MPTSRAEPLTGPRRGRRRIVAPGPWIAFGALALRPLPSIRLHAIRLVELIPMPCWMRNSSGCVLIALGLLVRLARQRHLPARWDAVPAMAADRAIIAAHDIYGRTRNPMYQGFLILVLGIAVLLRSDWDDADADARRHAGALRRGAARGELSRAHASAKAIATTWPRCRGTAGRFRGLCSRPLEAVEPLGIVDQDALAHRFVRHPDRDLIDQIAVVRHRRLQQHMRPVRAPHQAVGRGGDQRVRERRDVVIGRLSREVRYGADSFAQPRPDLSRRISAWKPGALTPLRGSGRPMWSITTSVGEACRARCRGRDDPRCRAGTARASRSPSRARRACAPPRTTARSWRCG